LWLLFIVSLAVVGDNCVFAPDDWSGVYDFTKIQDWEIGASDGDTYGFNACGPSSYCTDIGFPGMNLCRAGNGPTIQFSTGPGSWSLIDDNNFTAGAQLTFTGDAIQDMCPEPTKTTTVLQFLCRDPVNDGPVIDKYGDMGPPYTCNWVISFGSTVVCEAILNPPSRIYPPPPPGSNSTGLSGGSIFLIALLVTAVVYCVGGVLFQKFHKQQTGLSMIPNSQFWLSIPGLVKDGISYSWSKLRGGGRVPLASTGEGSGVSSYSTI